MARVKQTGPVKTMYCTIYSVLTDFATFIAEYNIEYKRKSYSTQNACEKLCSQLVLMANKLIKHLLAHVEQGGPYNCVLRARKFINSGFENGRCHTGHCV